jgi:hypothetical protein
MFSQFCLSDKANLNHAMVVRAYNGKVRRFIGAAFDKGDDVVNICRYIPSTDNAFVLKGTQCCEPRNITALPVPIVGIVFPAHMRGSVCMFALLATKAAPQRFACLHLVWQVALFAYFFYGWIPWSACTQFSINLCRARLRAILRDAANVEVVTYNLFAAYIACYCHIFDLPVFVRSRLPISGITGLCAEFSTGPRLRPELATTTLAGVHDDRCNHALHYNILMPARAAASPTGDSYALA